MTLPPVAPELAARLANYMIDDRARGVLRELAPLLEPHLGRAIDEVIAGAARLQQVAEVYKKHASEFRQIEVGQFQEMLRADFGSHYVNCCRNTIDREAALGFEGRARMNASAAVLRTAIAVLRRKHRFSPPSLPIGSASCRRRSSSILPPPRRSICSACATLRRPGGR